MDTHVARELLATRQAVKRKYQSLRSDMTQAELDLEKHWRPITQPLKELLTPSKRSEVATSSHRKRSEGVIFKKLSSTPIHDATKLPEFLASETVGEIEAEEPSVLQASMSPKTLWKRHQHTKGVAKEMRQMLSSSVMSEYLETFKGDLKNYVYGLIHDNAGEFDTAKGINLDLDKNEFRMGNKKVDFEGDMFIVFNGKKKIEYGLTPGLLELLFKKYPNERVIDAGDTELYKDVLNNTSAHKRYYDPKQQVVGSRGTKYKTLIKPQLSFKTKRSGRGVLTVTDKRLEFVPWKDPNALVDRLRILIASQMAGHTGHNNEITSIIDALRKAAIIK